MDQEHLFWVLLTIFGSVFATGLFIVTERFWLGLVETIFGLIGLVWLVRDHISLGAVRVRTPLLVLACVGISVFVGYSASQIIKIQRSVNRYVLPRILTEKQRNDLQAYLANHKTHPITVKVNPLDSEALEFAGQILSAFKQANWDATFDTSNNPPFTLNTGLHFCVVGSNAGPPDKKSDPLQIAQAAFRASKIELNGGGSIGAGEYKVFVLVGRRPLVVGAGQPMLVKLGQWITNLGYRR